MKKIPFASTNELVSEFALGTMNMGSSVPADISRQIMDAYWEAGGRFIDTANCYTRWQPGGTGGECEALIGQWLKERSDREEVFLATKVGLNYQDVPMGLAPEVIRQEIDRSLKRLQVECIDLYIAHRDDAQQPLEQTLAVFNELVVAGKIRYFGISNYHAHRVAQACAIVKANNLMPVVTVQNRFSYVRMNPAAAEAVDRKPHANRDVMLVCKEENIPIMAFSPLAKGAYVNPAKTFPAFYLGEDTDLRVAKLREVAQRLGVSPNQLVLRWMADKTDCKVIPLFAASNMEQMTENLGAASLELAQEIFDALDTAGVSPG